MRKCTDYFLLQFAVCSVKGVAAVFPRLFVYVNFFSAAIHGNFIIAQTADHAYFSVKIFFLNHIIFNEHDLRTFFQHQRCICRILVLGKFIFHLCLVNKMGRVQFLYLTVVYQICLLIVRSKCDIFFFFARAKARYKTLMKYFKIFRGHIVCANFVQQIHKRLFFLAVNFIKFYKYGLLFFHCMAVKEKWGRIIFL